MKKLILIIITMFFIGCDGYMEVPVKYCIYRCMDYTKKTWKECASRYIHKEHKRPCVLRCDGLIDKQYCAEYKVEQKEYTWGKGRPKE